MSHVPSGITGLMRHMSVLDLVRYCQVFRAVYFAESTVPAVYQATAEMMRLLYGAQVL